jgi:hypothetical protein
MEQWQQCGERIGHKPVHRGLLSLYFELLYRSMYDMDGPKVTDEFYRFLFRSDGTDEHEVLAEKPDMTQAALALHLAVKKLRKDECPFIRWVPFIHLGV